MSIEPHLAENARIERDGIAGPRRIYIDGEQIPWFTQGEATVEVTKGNMNQLTFTVLVDGPVEVFNKPATRNVDVTPEAIYTDEHLYPIKIVEG